MPEESPVLRIHQTPGDGGRHRVEVRFREPGRPEQSAHATVDLSFSEQDRRDLRWYLEDYLQHPFDPAPAIATRVEARIEEVGGDLFEQVFQASEQGRRLWARISDRLSDLRVEVVTGVAEAVAVPWELLRDPHGGTVLALTARAFVRTHDAPRQTPIAVEPGEGPIRILLVICRPRAGEDVPFRSVASRLVKALSAKTRAVYRLDVLRPPTYERLAAALRQAKAAGTPYHVVHFDGHGLYAELVDPEAAGAVASEWLRRLGALALGGARKGPHGYLLFENPDAEENLRPVGGEALGTLLRETGVPVLVLNACRSAFAEPRETPETAGAGADPPVAGAPEGGDSSDRVHTQVATFGSLAQEVIDAGVTGVVAMQYTVYVVTAAQFVADLYAALLRGDSLGQAVTLGRKQLHALPERTIAYDPRPLQDWQVPVVFEAAPTRLFPAGDGGEAPRLTIAAGASTGRAGTLDETLPRTPDAGFLGRDETLLALDRAFDRHPVVLLHALAGSGKTATAAELARWYDLTGGVDGPVLFSSFEQYLPLPRLLDRIGHVFGPALERAGVQWLALDDRRRREVALDVLRQVPVLWIWDNVEPVAGFPAGSGSAWSAEEQAALADFLRDAAGTRAKFLLTSRRDEQGWLGDLPRRVPVPPMPMQERVQLARALAEKRGRRLTEVKDWRPLLRFTEGNPLTITVLVGQALRDGLSTPEDIEAFVARLRKGEAAITDDAEQGRSRSLAASLRYGFDHAFGEEERKRLALLGFFQGFVDVDALTVMGHPEADWSLPEVRGLERED
ncbi:MAG: CHAT domain-containing protein [Thermoanaerobaculia bacterium]